MNIKQIIVLDLDETLLFSSLQHQESSINLGGYYVIFRPFLGDFLVSLSKEYSIAIWSSAGDQYVELLAHKMSELFGVEFLFIWGESKCSYSQVESIEHGNLKKDKKDLKKIVKKYAIPIENILIIDDDPIKVNRNYGNAIYIDKYIGANKDDSLLILKKYLLLIKDTSNFRLLEKRHWKSVIALTK